MKTRQQAGRQSGRLLTSATLCLYSGSREQMIVLCSTSLDQDHGTIQGMVPHGQDVPSH